MRIDEFETLPGMTGNAIDGMPAGIYDATSDTISTADITDTRKDRLTLLDLNKLKKLRAFRRLESLKRQDTLSVIYGEQEGGDDGLM